MQPPRGEEDLPYAELNSLYNHVLSNVRSIERVKYVLGVLIIVNPVENIGSATQTTQAMDDFLFWRPGETKACLSQLASIIEYGANGFISISHASLSDFLLDPSRSRQFYVCREFVLGNCIALGLRHMRKHGFDRLGVPLYPLRSFFFDY